MLNYNALMKEIDNLKNCYFIYSYDSKLVFNFLKQIESKIIIKDFKQFNYNVFKYDNNFDIQHFFEVSDTVPMFQEKKIIILENCTFLKREHENKETVNKLKEYFKNIPEYCIVICYYIFQEQEKNKDSLNSLSKIGEVCKIQELKGEEFNKEVGKLFKKYKLNIQNHLIKMFSYRVSNDFFIIENEILKLKSYVNDREVTKEDIEKVVSRSYEHNVFTFINEVLEKNIKKSIKSLKELTNNGKESNYIFSMLTNQFSKFLDIVILISLGYDQDKIVSKTKMNQYVVSNFIKLSRKYSLKDVSSILDGFLNIEYKMKTTSNIDLLFELESYIFTICSN